MVTATRSAAVLSVLQLSELGRAADILLAGGVVALPFNGIFALFGDFDQPHTHARIMAAKSRPADKRLALTTLPEYSYELIDFRRTPRSERDVVALWQTLHGLGLLLPARPATSSRLTRVQPDDGTALLVWSEYAPVRRILEAFRAGGGRALFGTSANKSGAPTATTARELWRSFATEIDALVVDDFSHLPRQRRQSTTILDLTGPRPRLHRAGSVSTIELQRALSLYGFGRLAESPPVL